MAVLYLFILRGGCDAGGHHRDSHIPRLRFHVWYPLGLLFLGMLLEVFMVLPMMFVALLVAIVSRCLRQRSVLPSKYVHFCVCMGFDFAALLVKFVNLCSGWCFLFA